MADNKNLGSDFDSYLNEKGVYKQIDDVAMHRVLAWQINEAMKEAGLSKTEMAERMNTSRSSLGRLLNPEKTVKLNTVEKAAKVLGKRLVIELV